jgi:glycine dehydrogenase subunit 2
MAHGAAGLKLVAETAALNNNYLATRLGQIPGVAIPYGGNGHRLQEVRYSWQPLLDATGVGTDDVRRRIVDFGLQGYFTSHHPVLVPEPFTLEPSETYAKDDLDEYAAVLGQISKEAHEDPDLVHAAPHASTIGRIDESAVDDPDRWAMTWRAFKRKHGATRQTAAATA